MASSSAHSATTIPTTTDHTLLSKARKARFDDLPTFSGHSCEDVERFLKRIKNMTRATDESDNYELLEIVRGKLTQSAGLWFDNNESSFRTWSDFETAFRNRYFPTTMAHQNFTKLKQRAQQSDESFTAYSDDVIELCRDIDPIMPERLIIHHLMSGLHPELKKELSRRDSSIRSLSEFLAYAQIEQDLYDTFKSSQNSLVSQSSYLPPSHAAISSLATMPNQPRPRHPNSRHNSYFSSSTPPQRSAPPPTPLLTPRTPTTSTPRRANLISSSQSHPRSVRHQPTPPNLLSKCKVCGRPNHRTIDCFHKRATGCFNCGNNHRVRDCTLPPNFQ